MAEKEWSENPEDDPIELQKQQLAISKKFMEKIENEERVKEELRKKQALAEPVEPYQMPKPPTFEERSVAIAKAWTETKKLVPDAPDHVKTIVFQTLFHSAASGEVAGFGGYLPSA